MAYLVILGVNVVDKIKCLHFGNEIIVISQTEMEFACSAMECTL